MEINEDLIIVNGKEIGTYDLYEIDRLATVLTSDSVTQEAIQQGASTVLEILHSAVDQRVIASFQIVHRS